jgi:hypothetical protein
VGRDEGEGQDAEDADPDDVHAGRSGRLRVRR